MSQNNNIMAFLSNIFSSNSDPKTNLIKWEQLTTSNQLEEIDTLSETQFVFIFKHSTRCSVSRFVLNAFEREYKTAKEVAAPFFLDLIAYREISNEIAARYEVVHQSPQLILIKNRRAVYNDSHDGISVEALEKQLI